jgi:hypothetical protein
MGPDDFVESSLQQVLRVAIQGKAVPLDASEDARPHPADWEGECIVCGDITTEWWWFDAGTKKCKCNRCMYT